MVRAPPAQWLRTQKENTARGIWPSVIRWQRGKRRAADASAATTLTYGLLPGADAASFDIESTTDGQLKTKAALDHETKDTYMVTVTVSDGKDAEDNFAPAVDDTIMVTIMVTDENEARCSPVTPPNAWWLRTQRQAKTSVPRW